MPTEDRPRGRDVQVDTNLIDIHRESIEQYERRQARDRRLGLAGLVFFGVLLVVYLFMEFVARGLVLLPGGHSEGYVALAVVGAVWAAWVGFDLGMNRRHRR